MRRVSRTGTFIGQCKCLLPAIATDGAPYPLPCHTRQLVGVELLRTFDVNNDLIQLARPPDSEGVFVGTQSAKVCEGFDERFTLQPEQRSGAGR